jgi:hypothetical protein
MTKTVAQISFFGAAKKTFYLFCGSISAQYSSGPGIRCTAARKISQDPKYPDSENGYTDG